MDASSSPFSQRLRLRSCGLLVKKSAILLIKIQSPITGQPVWMPPGGEVKFGESLKQGLKREFREETNISVEIGNLLHMHELIEEPFHAVECYFETSYIKGEASLGSDPELEAEEQLIKDLQWIPIRQLYKIPFAPEGLLTKLEHWESRANFSILESDT